MNKVVRKILLVAFLLVLLVAQLKLNINIGAVEWWRL